MPDSPAALAGMVAGDRIVSANGKAVASWDEFTAIVRDAPGEAVAVTVRRGGETVDLTVTPELIEETDVMGERIKYGRIGLYPWISYSAPEIRDEKHMNPLVAIQRGLELTGRWVVLTLQGFYYMVSGDVSVKSLGGPIMIADLAGKSAEGGAYSFMMFVAIISLNLAILNLLPIPVLDGGHLLLFAIEGVIRRPVPELGLKIATNVGLFLVGCLMVAAVYNDIARVFPGITTLFGILD
ncbi:MAG: RIP metalloprotease RseP [Deltaproteobacteria bacterium]|nr:RIP metalloprotease RseP [Deltaproteobacteria bacterium]